jgi:hypothetical protein
MTSESLLKAKQYIDFDGIYGKISSTTDDSIILKQFTGLITNKT